MITFQIRLQLNLKNQIFFFILFYLVLYGRYSFSFPPS